MDQYEGRDVLNLKNWEKFAAHRAKKPDVKDPQI
jgi:hypothetical protein